MGFVNYVRTRDPCRVAEEERIYLMEEELSEGVFTSSLPKIVHQQWRTNVIPEGNFVKWRGEFKRLFPEPEYQHRLWTDKDMHELIATKYTWFLPHYEGYAHNIQRADSSRYFILNELGGIYADLDYKPLTNFWDSLPKNRPGFIESPYKYNEAVQNSLMSSPPGHPFWNITFQVLMERSKSSNILASTGPSLLDEATRRAKVAGLGDGVVYELPCENFHRVPTGEAGKESPWIVTFFRQFMSLTVFVKPCGDVKNDRCQFGIHHNSASWVQKSSFW